MIQNEECLIINFQENQYAGVLGIGFSAKCGTKPNQNHDTQPAKIGIEAEKFVPERGVWIWAAQANLVQGREPAREYRGRKLSPALEVRLWVAVGILEKPLLCNNCQSLKLRQGL